MGTEDLADLVQTSANGDTVWVHSPIDGTTVGRFSRRAGMDVHTTISAQLAGASQCLHCTHERPSHADWVLFCSLMLEHHGIDVDPRAMVFPPG